MVLTSLLIMACSSFFLIESRVTSPGMVLSTMGCVPRHQSIIKKNTLQAFLQLEIRRHFLNWGFLLILASNTPIIGVYVKLLKQGHHFLYSSCHLSCYLIEFLIVSCHSPQSICFLHLAEGGVKGRCGGNHHP